MSCVAALRRPAVHPDRCIINAYGHEAASCVLRRRRTRELLAGRGALGVTQPAVSLQVRALEKRWARSCSTARAAGSSPRKRAAALSRRPAPARARGAAVADVAESTGPDGGPAGRNARARGVHGPAAIVVPLLLCEFHAENPGVDVSPVRPTTRRRIVSASPERELELGIVGQPRRRARSSSSRSSRDEVVLAGPPDHPFAGRRIDRPGRSRGSR